MLKLFIYCSSFILLSTSLMAEDNKVVNFLNSNVYIDIAEEIKESLTVSALDPNCSIHNFSTVPSERSLNYIYTTNCNHKILNINSYYGSKSKVTQNNVELPEHFIGKEYSAIHFPYEKRRGVLLSTQSGYIHSSISYDSGNSWINCNLGNYVTSSSILYIYNTGNGKYIAYFIGKGDLTSVNSSAKSMVYQIISTDKGETWGRPTIAIKHNLRSLNTSSFFKIRGKRGTSHDILYNISSSNEGGEVYYSSSIDKGITWSYPKEIPPLKGTSNHIISSYKDRAVLLYTKSYEQHENKKDAVFLFTSNVRQFETGRFKGELYRIYEYTPKMKALRNDNYNSIDAIIYRPKQMVLSIASNWDGDHIYIKSMQLNMHRYF